MFVLIVAAMVVVGLLAAVGLAALVVFGIGSSKKQKARRHAVLNDSFQRLKTVVAELLERVNELDEHLRFVDDRQKVSASKDRLSVAAGDLVTVMETLSAIDQLLAERRFNDAADLLSASCRVIDKVVRIISQIEPDVGIRKISGDPGVTIKVSKPQRSHAQKKDGR